MLHLPKMQRFDGEGGSGVGQRMLVASQSQGSSLALSALSTPLATEREGDDHDAASTKPSTTRSGMDAASTVASASMVMAKLDVSDFLAPLEARLYARMDAIEAMVERRCCALERRANGYSEDAGRQQSHTAPGIQGQVDSIRASLQADMSKSEAVMSDLYKQIQSCQETMQNNVGEIWRQLKADRQDAQVKYQNLSDALESRIQSLVDKVDSRSAPPAQSHHRPHHPQHRGYLPSPSDMSLAEEDEDAYDDDDEEELTPRSAAAANGNVIRARSTPSMGPGYGFPGGMPVGGAGTLQGANLERFSTMPPMLPGCLKPKGRERFPGCPLASAAAAAAQQQHQQPPHLAAGKSAPNSPPPPPHAAQPRSLGTQPLRPSARQPGAASPRGSAMPPSPVQRDMPGYPQSAGLGAGSSPARPPATASGAAGQPGGRSSTGADGLQRRVSAPLNNSALRPGGNAPPPQRPVQTGATGFGAPGGIAPGVPRSMSQSACRR